MKRDSNGPKPSLSYDHVGDYCYFVYRYVCPLLSGYSCSILSL